MRKTTKSPGEKIVKDIKRATRKHYSSEEKIRIVLDLSRFCAAPSVCKASERRELRFIRDLSPRERYP